jgi:hypothetical protein
MVAVMIILGEAAMLWLAGVMEVEGARWGVACGLAKEEVTQG